MRREDSLFNCLTDPFLHYIFNKQGKSHYCSLEILLYRPQQRYLCPDTNLFSAGNYRKRNSQSQDKGLFLFRLPFQLQRSVFRLSGNYGTLSGTTTFFDKFTRIAYIIYFLHINCSVCIILYTVCVCKPRGQLPSQVIVRGSDNLPTACSIITNLDLTEILAEDLALTSAKLANTKI